MVDMKVTAGDNRALTAIKIGFVIVGLYAIVSRLWAAEDAYITFRYIDNFLHGYGLVYNVGDRVEGFTHPFWLFLVTIPAALGLPIRTGALLISMGLTLASLFLLAFRDRDHEGKAVAVPLALLLLLTHTGFRDFSVSGLEFPLVCLLMVWFYQSYSRHDLLGKPYLHGTLLAVLYLARPELVLLIVSFYAVLGWRIARRYLRPMGESFTTIWTGIWKFSLPIIAIAGGYHLFRWLYYDAIFPNTYYAKAGSEAYWYAGIKYFGHFWRYSPFLLIAFVGWLVMIAVSRKFRAQAMGSTQRIIMLAQASLLALYVIRLGGDFMAYRFLLPVMVILVLLLNDSLNYVIHSRKQMVSNGIILLVVTVILVLIPIRVPQGDGYIADERQYYDLYHPAYRALFDEPTEHKWYRQGRELKALQEQTGYPISIGDGNIGYLGFAAGPKVAIVDIYGLVDKQTARNWGAVSARGRPGHEGKLTLQMAVDRNVTVYQTPFKEWNKIMGTPYGTIITIDPIFIRNFPDRVAALKEYKRLVKTGDLPQNDSYLFLQTLETKFGILVEDL